MVRCFAFLFALAACAQSNRPLIAIGQFTHESNSFNPAKTTLADFQLRNNAQTDVWRKNKDEVSGYLEGADQYGFDVYPTVLANATPKGPVTEEALTKITSQMIARLKAAPRKLDGLLLALHGAMVTENYPHGDVEIMKRLRAALGPAFPIVVTHDFHANVSPEMEKLTTALITYKEVPHIDQKDRGLQAARIMAGIAAGRVKPVQAIVKPPMIYNIVFQYTKVEPLLPIVAETKRLERNPKILACSVSGGYQYADVPFVGPTVIVVTDNDPDLARREAQRLSDMLWATRDRLVLKLPEPAEAVRQAIASDKAPVVLVEMGDNIGGGSSGDATFMLSELVKQKASGWVVVLADPGAAQAAARAGIGQPFDMPVGGKADRLHGQPVRIRGVVKSLHDGKFLEPEVRHGGQTYYDQGLTAVIEAEGSTRDLSNLLMLTTRRQVPFSLHQLISCGIYPQRQKILVVKAAIAYKAAYEPIAGRIIDVDTGGTTAVNPKRFTFRRARRPLFGLE
ncbi:MAG: M81 family metallopeptidase [Acidobacteria bacterium]|nr:M81 family metallopeptidase [Acidobacteriota bacterium]